MSKYKLYASLFLYFGLIALSLSHLNQPQKLYSQTIPSPTPVVIATETATAIASPTAIATSTPGGSNPTPVIPTTATATSATVAAPTFAPSPQGGYLPTAVPCEDSPTIQAFNTLNVRQGPDESYPIITQLIFWEVRPIIGRSQYNEWWVIELTNGDPGWVADAIGLVQGFIGNVPLVPAPPLNGQTPTPSALWQPTVQPTCTVTPTPTPSPTGTASATPSATVTATAVTATATTTSTPNSQNEAVAATRIASLSLVATPIPTQIPTAYPILATPLPPLEGENGASTPNLLPIVGLVFIAGGIFVAIARRQFSKQ